MYRPGSVTRPAIAQLIFLASSVANSPKTGLESSSFISLPEFRAGSSAPPEGRAPSSGSLNLWPLPTRETKPAPVWGPVHAGAHPIIQETCPADVPITLNSSLNLGTPRAGKYLPADCAVLPSLPCGCIMLGSVVRWESWHAAKRRKIRWQRHEIRSGQWGRCAAIYPNLSPKLAGIAARMPARSLNRLGWERLG